MGGGLDFDKKVYLNGDALPITLYGNWSFEFEFKFVI